jgi:hypothetical protein
MGLINFTPPYQMPATPVPGKTKKIMLVLIGIIIVAVLMMGSFWGGTIYYRWHIFGPSRPAGIQGTITGFENNVIALNTDSSAELMLPGQIIQNQNDIKDSGGVWQIKITPLTKIIQRGYDTNTGEIKDSAVQSDEIQAGQSIYAESAGSLNQNDLNKQKSFEAGQIVIYP